MKKHNGRLKMTKKIFLSLIISVFGFAFNEAQAAEKRYCNFGTPVKSLFTSRDGSKSKVTCYEYADQVPDADKWLVATTKDKEIKSFTGTSDDRPIEKCLTECVGLDSKTAKLYRENRNTPAAQQVLHAKPTVDTPKKTAAAVPDKSPFCSEGQQSKDGTWKSNCGYNDNGYNLKGKYSGKTQKEAIEECGLKCLRTQASQLRQSGNGTWR